MWKVEYGRRYAEKHRDRVREKHRSRRKRLGYKHKRDPLKEAARKKLRNEVAAGRVHKPENCTRCGVAAVLHGRHEDYSKPLDVIWVCSICHGKLHRVVDQAREALREAGEEL